MATWDDVRAVASSLPATTEGTSWGNLSWKVQGKLFVWERPLRKSDLAALGDAAPSGAVLGVKVEHEGAKRALLEAEPDRCFTTPHFDGHPIVLVRLDPLTPAQVEEFVTEAWLCAAPGKLADAWLAEHRS